MSLAYRKWDRLGDLRVVAGPDEDGLFKGSHLKAWSGLLALLWSVAFAASFGWNLVLNRDLVLERALTQASAAIEKDFTYRGFVSGVGGVYIPVDKGVEPNPYLQHLPHRDITTEDGRKLTLVNSSYFTRLVYDQEATWAPKGIRSHVSGLNPLRPANAADAWEREALQAFQKGVSEWYTVANIQGEDYFRLMRPRFATPACLECHINQDIKPGDVLGGIAVTVPLAPIQTEADRWLAKLGIWHAVLWWVGLTGIYVGYRLLARQEQLIRYSALHDVLTGLPNRALFMDRLIQRLASAKRHAHIGAVLYLDLDRFKTINDSVGHGAGDELLKGVAGRLAGILRGEDTVSRLGGDEFAVLLGELSSDSEVVVWEVKSVAEKILSLLAEPFNIGNKEFHTTTSIGVVLFNEDSESPQEVMRQADAAMYRAKGRGGNGFQFFLPSMQYEIEEQLEMESALRLALERNEFELYYQPLVDLSDSGMIVGAEALLRWQHPERGMITPSVFIPVAEETGLIKEIGAWVFRRVCAQIKEWQKSVPGGMPGRIAINISPRQFQDSGFVPEIRRCLQETGVDAQQLIIELTENLLLGNIEEVAAKMQELRGLGMQLSIDDFGTGYSSLAYLKRLPLHVLKIDRSFIRDLTTDSNDAAIVESILAMALRLGFDTVGEGVESEEQLAFLRKHQCNFYQGDFYSPPLPAGEFQQRLRAQSESTL
jgi:diguanylate cyclase (GGDEF)-like protein